MVGVHEVSSSFSSPSPSPSSTKPSNNSCLPIAPPGFPNPLPRSHQGHGHSVEAVKKGLEIKKEEFCVACMEKWSSDITNIQNFDIYKLTAYLRAEFNSVIRKEADKRLRDLEQAQVKTEEKLRNAENLEEELRNYKDKCYELSVEIGRLEVIKSDTEAELYIKANEELTEKLVYFDDVDRDRSDAFIELTKACEELRERVSKLEEVNRCNSEELHKYKVECENLKNLEVELNCHDLKEKITLLEVINRNISREVTELKKYKSTCSHPEQVNKLEGYKVTGKKLLVMTARPGIDRNKSKVQGSEASKAKTVAGKENEDENCAPRLNELVEIRERNSLECHKRNHENSACSTIKEKDTNKRRKCKGVIEQVDAGAKNTVRQETMKVKDVLLEREKMIRCQERLEKQVGNTTGNSAVKEVVKVNSVSLENRKRKGNSNHEDMEKQVEAKRTDDEVEKALKDKGTLLKISSGLSKEKLSDSDSIQPNAVEGPNRRVATLKGVEPATSHQPIGLPPVQEDDVLENVQRTYCTDKDIAFAALKNDEEA